MPRSTHAAQTGRRPAARRRIRLLGLTAAGALLVAVVAGLAAPGPGKPLGVATAGAADGWETRQTEFGPLTAGDRELLERVRLANLWERPVGLQAQERAGSDRVKEVGAQLAADHLRLETAVTELGEKLDVALPTKPYPIHQEWMDELSTLRGEAFDRAFANKLRAAHGTVFGVVAEVRAQTSNTEIRAFAQTAVSIVMKHMTLLESTDTYAPAETLASALEPPPAEGPITLPVIVGVVALIVVANLVVAARRSWS